MPDDPHHDPLCARQGGGGGYRRFTSNADDPLIIDLFTMTIFRTKTKNFLHMGTVRSGSFTGKLPESRFILKVQFSVFQNQY